MPDSDLFYQGYNYFRVDDIRKGSNFDPVEQFGARLSSNKGCERQLSQEIRAGTICLDPATSCRSLLHSDSPINRHLIRVGYLVESPE
jgi:hypothetical protein